VLGAAPAPGALVPIVLADAVRWARVVHARRLLPGLWRAGLAYVPVPPPADRAHAYLAA
jgi:cellulose synthase (UDP-forming)